MPWADAFLRLRVDRGKLREDVNAGLTGVSGKDKGREIAANFAAGAVIGIAVAIGAASKFQESLTTLATGAGEAEDRLKMVGDGIKQIAVATGTSTGELVKGMFQIESAGFHGASGLNVLRAAAEGAKIGNADLGVVANALTTVMTDYRLKSTDAAKAMGGLDAIVSHGKVHLEDLASSMSRVLPTASALHVSFGSVGGAMATMTGEGISARLAAMGLNAAMLALAAPSSTAAKEMKKVGLSSKEVADTLTHQGILAAMKEITDAAGKHFPAGSAAYVAAINQMVGGSRGLQVALALTGHNLSAAEANTRAVSKAYQEGGKHVTGWAAVQKDASFQLDRVKAAAGVAAINLGTVLLPAFTKVAAVVASNLLPALSNAVTGLKTAGEWVAKYKSWFEPAAIAVGVLTLALNAQTIALKAMYLWDTVVAAGSKLLAAGMFLVDAAMDANPVTLIIVALIALGAALAWAWTHSATFRNVVEGAWKAVKDAALVAWGIIKTAIGGIVAAWQSVVAVFDRVKAYVVGNFDKWWASHGAEVVQVWRALWGAILAAFHFLFDPVVAAVRFGIGVITAVIRAGMTVVRAVISAAIAVIVPLFHAWWAVMTLEVRIAWIAIQTIIRVAWAVISGVIRVELAFIRAIIKITWDIIVGIFNVFLDVVTGHWGKAWRDIRATVTQVGNAIRGFLSVLWNTIYTTAIKVWNALRTGIWSILRVLWAFIWGDFGSKIYGFFLRTLPSWWDQAYRFVYQRLVVPWKKVLTDLKNWIWTDFIQKIYNFFVVTLPSYFGKAVTLVGRAWQAVGNAVKNPVNWVIQHVINGLIDAFDWIGSHIGLGKKVIPDLGGLATGGRIPGYGGGDKHLALLEGGEAVVDKDRTRQYGWFLKAIGVPGFQGGGLVGGIGNLLGDIGHVASGFISKAADIGKITAALATGNTTAMTNALSALFGHGTGGAGSSLGQLLTQIPKELVSKAVEWLIGQFASTGGGVSGVPGAGVQRWRGTVLQALKMEGLGAWLANRVLYQMQTESGGNQYAINRTDINAQRGDPSRGLLQTIMATFRAFHWPGTSWNIYDGLANVAAAINYARARYGPSLMRGGMGMGSGHGYAAGTRSASRGPAWVGEAGPELVNFAGGESVTPLPALGSGESAGRLLAKLDELIAAAKAAPHHTGIALGDTLNGVARGSTYGAAPGRTW